MEQPQNLLDLVLEQHYLNRKNVLEEAEKIEEDYQNNIISYQETLSSLYRVLNDLPTEILLYYLTTVPLPAQAEIDASSSNLPTLMKQMLVPSYHNSIRPILLKYLNDVTPPMTDDSATENLVDQSTLAAEPEMENVKSVIDEKIQQSKKRTKKTVRGKRNPAMKKQYNVKPLAMLCATNVLKNYPDYYYKYCKQKTEAWNLVSNKKVDQNLEKACRVVINDAEKKIKWLNMFKSGNIKTEVLEEEYGNSEVFYKERHLQNSVNEDVLLLKPEVLQSINNFFDSC